MYSQKTLELYQNVDKLATDQRAALEVFHETLQSIFKEHGDNIAAYRNDERHKLIPALCVEYQERSKAHKEAFDELYDAVLKDFGYAV